MNGHSLPQRVLPSEPRSRHDELASGLGWFSIGLGMLECAAAGKLCRALALEPHETLVRTFGMREMATGVAILASHDPAPWIWGRAIGNALDLATLATAAERARGGQRANVALALAAVIGVAVLDVACARGLDGEKEARTPAVADYRGRSGFLKPASAMRGAARGFEIPKDMRVPDLLRSYAVARALRRPAAAAGTSASRKSASVKDDAAHHL